MDFTQQQLQALYAGVKMRAFSDQTPTTVAALYRQIKAEHASGYVVLRSGYTPGIVSVAAPVRDADGVIVAGVNVSDHESLPALKGSLGQTRTMVVAAAETISNGLGYRGPRRSL
jgi:DNA-binding IclR family transcriptional regulator